jgi:hypothetical protein
MEASLGNKPSFAWRSIFGAKDLLNEGLIWMIGDGRDVRIWQDKWLPTPTTYAIQSPRVVLPDHARVSCLIDPNSRWWNRQLLNYIFSINEASIISNIPLSRYGHKDKMIWRGTTTGDFTVRSAYHMEKERSDANRGECSVQSDLNNLWKKIWGLKVHNPLKKILWRACHNILPTRDNLQFKGFVSLS